MWSMTDSRSPLAPLRSKDELVAMMSGRGIEIGALIRPIVSPELEVTYVDEMSTEEMIRRYPELEGANPVHVDIVDDGAKLENVADGSQDFVIASHLIEHLPDPIGGLLTWQRVLKPGGKLFLVVPDKEQTFDATRAITEHEHLLQDYLEPSEERDFEHFADFALHVSCRTYNSHPEEEYREYAQYLVGIGYSIHYHVWDLAAFRGLLRFLPERVPDFAMRPVGESGVLTEEFCFVLEKQA